MESSIVERQGTESHCGRPQADFSLESCTGPQSIPACFSPPKCRSTGVDGAETQSHGLCLYPVNMPAPIWKHFGYSQLWLLWPACGLNRAGLYMPDRTSRIWFSSIFPKKAGIILCKTNLDLIWVAWSGFGQTHLVWKKASVQESPGPVSGRMKMARYQFPTFTLGCVLPQTFQIILYKTSVDPIWFWQTVSGLGWMDPVRKQASVQDSSGLFLANAFKRIQIRCESDPACLRGIYHVWVKVGKGLWWLRRWLDVTGAWRFMLCWWTRVNLGFTSESHFRKLVQVFLKSSPRL